jgi:hypothetical protein
MHTNVSTGTLHYHSVTCNVAQEEMSSRDRDSLASKSLAARPKPACFYLSRGYLFLKLKVVQGVSLFCNKSFPSRGPEI